MPPSVRVGGGQEPRFQEQSAARASVLRWVRSTCAGYELDVVALYRRSGDRSWPLVARSSFDLERQLEERGHFLPLPREPAALANILEVSVASFILRQAAELAGAVATRGAERGYPDIELSGPAFGDAFHAVDIKVARGAAGGKRTQSRITLYTGNTYFRWPELRWPGMLRPFGHYASHLDVVVVYTLDRESVTQASDIDLRSPPASSPGRRRIMSAIRGADTGWSGCCGAPCGGSAPVAGAATGQARGEGSTSRSREPRSRSSWMARFGTAIPASGRPAGSLAIGREDPKEHGAGRPSERGLG